MTCRTDKTVDPCVGLNSDFFPEGGTHNAVNTTPYSTCRPQLHAAGIGTYLNPVYCEDSALRGAVTRDTVYTTIAHLGAIFNVPQVATQLVSEIRNDFNIAQQTLQASGHSLKAVWLDCITCCGGVNSDKVRCCAWAALKNHGDSSPAMQRAHECQL